MSLGELLLLLVSPSAPVLCLIGVYAHILTNIGMYNVPSFTLARAIGGLTYWYWRSYKKRAEAPIVILASGLILGEGVCSIVNLLLASAKVPHL